jgi:hypothetical protein
MRDELSGWRFYVALVPVLAIVGAGIWWRATGYRTGVGLGIVAVGLVALVVGLVASRFLSHRR